MTHATRSKWHLSVAMLAIAGALAIGTTLAWAAVPAAVVFAEAPDNSAAAITAFNQARNLYQQGKYTEAGVLNDKALQLDPTNKNAQLLHKILLSKTGNTSTSITPASAPTDAVPAKSKQLSLQQVSQVRLLELAPAETQIRGTIDRNTLEDFWNTIIKNQPDFKPAGHDAFVNPKNFIGQLRAFQKANNADFLARVQITSDPADLIEFRRTVHAYVLKNCATSACHGGDKAGDFRLLLPSPPITDQLLYTNFYIMSMYTAKDGSKMINRDDPDSSLFLQYSLPKNSAKFSHPGTVTPHHLTGTDDPQFKLMSDWVRSLALPRPDYRIVYDLPKTATQPATSTRPAPHPTK